MVLPRFAHSQEPRGEGKTVGRPPFSKGALAIHLDPPGLGNAVCKGPARGLERAPESPWNPLNMQLPFRGCTQSFPLSVGTPEAPDPKMDISRLELVGDSVPISV